MKQKSYFVLTIASLLAGGNLSQAQTTTVYFQDFSASNPVDESDGTPITEGSLVEQDGLSFTGGDVGNQATDGDYTYTMTSGNGATTGNGFVVNAPGTFFTAGYNGPTTDGTPDYQPGAGIANVDEAASFSTGTITLADGATGSFTMVLNAFNTGGEFLSLNSVTVTEDAATGEVTLSVSMNGFGDFADGGNENIGLTTDFSGGVGAFTNLAFAIAGNNGATNFENSQTFIDATGIDAQNQGFGDLTFDFVLREALPQVPSLSPVLYSQDFTASNPMDDSGTIVSIADDVLYDSMGQNITGGDALNQATNGDYTIDLIRTSMSVPFDPGDPAAEPPIPPTAADQNGFMFNGDPLFVPESGSQAPFAGFVSTGFAGIDQNFIFTSGLITIDDNGTPRTGTVTISAGALNVGGEFFNLGLVQVGEDANGDAFLVISYDAFGDFAPGDPDADPPVAAGNESFLVTTDFGAAGDLTSFDISPDTINNGTTFDVFTHNLVIDPVEPSTELEIVACGFTPSGDFFITLESDATGATVEVSTDLDADPFSSIASSSLGATITIAAGDLPANAAFFRVSL